jgi:hypothetical protein
MSSKRFKRSPRMRSSRYCNCTICLMRSTLLFTLLSRLFARIIC